MKILIYEDDKLIKAIYEDEYEEKYEVMDALEDWVIDMRKNHGYDSE